MAHFFLRQWKGLKQNGMTLNPTLTEQLQRLIESEGLELVATEMAGTGPKSVLRLVVDGPDGVDLDQCAAISREASVILDVEDPVAHTYTLEVTSPGLDRKLYSPQDYDRFSGRQVAVRMAPSFRKHRTVTGILDGLSDGIVALETDNGERIDLPIDQISEARLVIDWDAMMKKRKS